MKGPKGDVTETLSLGGSTLQDSESFSPPSVASRARNRTVMLSPDLTGQVRSLLQSPLNGGDFSDHGPFQKPKEALNNVDNADYLKDKKDEPAKSNGLHFKEVSHNIDSKSERVEGTLELKHEHSRLATSDRKFEELGIGVPNVVPEVIDQSRHSTSFNLERKLLQKDAVISAPLKAPTTELIRPKIQATSATRVVGFLVSYDHSENGEITELRVGRWLVSSKPSSQDQVIIFDDPSISALHAVIKVSETGEVQLMDQLSDRGTGVLKVQTGQELDASESSVKVQHGDLVRFGQRYFVYCGIPKIQIEN